MFSLTSMKQLKYQERAHIISFARKYGTRIRAVHKLICRNHINIIAEIKKASPVQGAIKTVDPAQQAVMYQRSGASAVSVLTDGCYFGGSFEDLYQAANAVSVPVVCKEFICYPEQIDAAYTAGADMILLIASMLANDELRLLYEYTLAKGLQPLVEVHAPAQLEDILPLNPDLIMVNMRNLTTLSIDHDTGVAALRAIPPGITKICASSISNAYQIRAINESTGAAIFLVGTVLMQSENPSLLIKELSNVC